MLAGLVSPVMWTNTIHRQSLPGPCVVCVQLRVIGMSSGQVCLRPGVACEFVGVSYCIVHTGKTCLLSTWFQDLPCFDAHMLPPLCGRISLLAVLIYLACLGIIAVMPS